MKTISKKYPAWSLRVECDHCGAGLAVEKDDISFIAGEPAASLERRYDAEMPPSKMTFWCPECGNENELHRSLVPAWVKSERIALKKPLVVAKPV